RTATRAIEASHLMKQANGVDVILRRIKKEHDGCGSNQAGSRHSDGRRRAVWVRIVAVRIVRRHRRPSWVSRWFVNRIACERHFVKFREAARRQSARAR